MPSEWTEDLESILSGPLLESAASKSLLFRAVLCDLRPRFIPKGRVGRGYRAVARNGRVLLASNLSMESLIERDVRIRIQPWRKAILPEERPETHGVLMCVRCLDPAPPSEKTRSRAYRAWLVNETLTNAELVLDVGGGMKLVFAE